MSAAANASADDVKAGRLPKKEQELFKNVMANYEAKHYKKGIKNADLILKKYPNHGETLAMKGLITNCLGKKEEAYELVKAGLRNGVRSHICWHVFGLLHKSDKNLKEASKCYLNALRIDPSNQNILRDLSTLQLQVRDLSGFVVTRRKLLDARPSLGTSWIAYAVGNYLMRDYAAAFDIVNKYLEGSTQDSNLKSAEEKHAESELLLFQNKCLQEQGKYDEAIVHIRSHEIKLVDGLSARVKVAELLLFSGRFEEAKVRWYLLVKEQGENFRFHAGLQAALLQLPLDVSMDMCNLTHMNLPSTMLPLTDDQCAMLAEYYTQHKAVFKARAYDKIMLTLVRGPAFAPLLEAFIRKNLHDEVPALVHDVCWLVRGIDPLANSDSNGNSIRCDSSGVSISGSSAGTDVIATMSSRPRFVCWKDPVDFRSHPVSILVTTVIDRFVQQLEKDSTFDGRPTASMEPSEKKEAPGVLLWAMFFQAHWLERCGNVPAALALIERCIEHTPTALDMYCKKAHLLKQSGTLVAAAKVMDYCRTLDLQDRYLNNKTTKFLMRSDQIDDGMNTIAMFTKDEGDPQQALYDLQVNWYELELAEAYARGKRWGQALKKFHAIQTHFQAYFDDMSEFHGYALRKHTMRCYTSVLAWQDTLTSHPFYQRACRGVLTIYLHLLDCPEDTDGLGHLPTAERKKERARIKKLREKEKKEAEAKEQAAIEEAKWNGEKLPTDDQIKDQDPLGEAYVSPKAPATFLTEAAAWCTAVLPQTKACDPDTLVLMTEVMLRRGKFLQVNNEPIPTLPPFTTIHPSYPDNTTSIAEMQAIRCLKCGLTRTPHHPGLSVMLVKFAAKVGGGASNAGAGSPPEVKPTVQGVVKEELASLIGSAAVDLQAFSTRYTSLARSLNSLPHRIAAARIAVLCDKTHGKNIALSLLIEEEVAYAGRGITIETLLDVMATLSKDLKLDPLIIEETTKSVRARGATMYPLASAFSTTPPLPPIDPQATIANDQLKYNLSQSNCDDPRSDPVGDVM